MGSLTVSPAQNEDAALTLVEARRCGVPLFHPVTPNRTSPMNAEQHSVDGDVQQEIGDEWDGVIVGNVDFLAGMKRLAFCTLNSHLKD
jgi:redox-sensing transcriptional repressor